MEIDQKKLKKILEKQRKEYQTYLGALTEHFESQVKLIAETLIEIQKQLSSIRDMVAKNTEDIEFIKMDLHLIKDNLQEKISREEFKALEKRLELLEKKVQKSYR